LHVGQHPQRIARERIAVSAAAAEDDSLDVDVAATQARRAELAGQPSVRGLEPAAE
jgi:hypothetical protein